MQEQLNCVVHDLGIMTVLPIVNLKGPLAAFLSLKTLRRIYAG